MSSPNNNDDMDGVDIAAKKAKLILNDIVNDEEKKKPKALPRPKRPYPHLALRLALVRLLHKKDPRNACARAFCVGPIHDPSLVVDIERRFMAGRFHPELEYRFLKHPWRLAPSTLVRRNVPRMVHYIMVTGGLAVGWASAALFGRFPLLQRLKHLLVGEEWDVLIYNDILRHLFTDMEAASALFWLDDDRTVDSVLNLRVGRYMLKRMFEYDTRCWCAELPIDKETRERVALPRLRRLVDAYQQHHGLATKDSVALRCLMQPPFGDTVFAAIDWTHFEESQSDLFIAHPVEHFRLEDERRRRQQANTKP